MKIIIENKEDFDKAYKFAKEALIHNIEIAKKAEFSGKVDEPEIILAIKDSREKWDTKLESLSNEDIEKDRKSRQEICAYIKNKLMKEYNVVEDTSNAWR